MSTTSGISNMRAASIPKAASPQGTSASPQQKINNIFQQIDSSGTGRITKAQFEKAFNELSLPESIKGIGKDAAFSKLDPSGSGVVTKQDFIRGMQALMSQKPATVKKEASPEVKPIVAPKTPANSLIAQNQPTNNYPQSGSGKTGNTINITA